MVFEMVMIFFLVFVSIISLPILLLYISNVDLIDLEPCCLSMNLWQCFYLVNLQIGIFSHNCSFLNLLFGILITRVHVTYFWYSVLMC